MADTSTETTGAQAAPASPPPAGDPKPAAQAAVGTPSTTGTQTPPASPADDEKDGDDKPESISLEDARKLRSEARSLRQRLSQAEARVKEADDAKLSEQERLQQRVAELETGEATWKQQRRELLVRQAVERAARRLNLVDEEAAYLLLEKDGLEEGDGLGSEVETRLKALLKEKSWLQAKPAQAAAVPPSEKADDGRGASAEDDARRRRELAQRVGRYVA